MRGRDLRAERQRFGLRQAALAKALGISETTIIDIERERLTVAEPSIEEMVRTVRILAEANGAIVPELAVTA